MFKKIQRELKPPSQATLVWDGECGFCRYWVTVWQNKTGDSLRYKTYQDVYDRFESIPLNEFKKASRLIEPDGKVFSGPDSAYRSFIYFQNPIRWPHKWYQKYTFFRKFSDHTYNWIAKHRPFMFKVTKLLWGTDPNQRKPHWLVWLLLFMVLIFLCYFLISFKNF